MNTFSVEELNGRIARGAEAFAAESEAAYEKTIAQTAESLAACRTEKPIIFAAGPSGAGKTTTAKRIEAYLEGKGITTHVISMDNYFCPLSAQELSKIDLEAPERLDIELMTSHLEAFFNCEPVQLPIFVFANQTRVNGNVLQRKRDEMIIIEGIHALNPLITGTTRHASRIYINLDSEVSFRDGILTGNKIRLMRRLMRDHLFRGRTIHDILLAFRSVERGERLFISPFKGNAEYIVDTFLPYELFIYKKLLMPELGMLSGDDETNSYIRDILSFCTEAGSLSADLAPQFSLIREFTGGSGFDY